ncbi:hypothetical protein [Amycolatopsis sp. NPDC054798]
MPDRRPVTVRARVRGQRNRPLGTRFEHQQIDTLVTVPASQFAKRGPEFRSQHRVVLAEQEIPLDFPENLARQPRAEIENLREAGHSSSHMIRNPTRPSTGC